MGATKLHPAHAISFEDDMRYSGKFRANTHGASGRRR
jgi:hypothetical protein